jgi:hypothetical protein
LALAGCLLQEGFAVYAKRHSSGGGQLAVAWELQVLVKKDTHATISIGHGN